MRVMSRRYLAELVVGQRGKMRRAAVIFAPWPLTKTAENECSALQNFPSALRTWLSNRACETSKEQNKPAGTWPLRTARWGGGSDICLKISLAG